MKSLTVAIPTLDGFPHLEEAVSSVLSQMASSSGCSVEMVIANNGSKPETSNYLASLTKNHNVTVLDFDQNLGFDRNLWRLLSHVKGDFVWFLGDDDILLPGTIGHMCKVLNSNTNPQVLLCPPSFFTDNSSQREMPPFVPKKAVFDDGVTFIKQTLWSSSALSSLCWRTDSLRNLEIDPATASNWIHVMALMKLSSHPGEFIVLEEDLVAVRVGNQRWATHFGNQFSVGIDHITVIRDSFDSSVDKSIYEAFLLSRFEGNWISILVGVGPMPMLDRHHLARRMKTHFSRFPRFYFLDLPMLYSPRVIRTLIYQCGSFFRKRQSQIYLWRKRMAAPENGPRL